jgi:hypothetical protein
MFTFSTHDVFSGYSRLSISSISDKKEDKNHRDKDQEENKNNTKILEKKVLWTIENHTSFFYLKMMLTLLENCQYDKKKYRSDPQAGKNSIMPDSLFNLKLSN